MPKRVGFKDLMKLPLDERRTAMLERLEDLYEAAMGRVYTNKYGLDVASPDVLAGTKVIQVVSKLVGLDGEPPENPLHAAKGQALWLQDKEQN